MARPKVRIEDGVITVVGERKARTVAGELVTVYMRAGEIPIALWREETGVVEGELVEISHAVWSDSGEAPAKRSKRGSSEG